MTRYYLYKYRSDIKHGWRLYLHPVYTSTGERLPGVVEQSGKSGALRFSPKEAVQGMLQGYRPEEVSE